MPIPPEMGVNDLTGSETIGALQPMSTGVRRIRASLSTITEWAQRQRDMTPVIAQAVATYLTAHPPASGKDATDAQVAASVSAYLQAHPPAAGKDAEAPRRAVLTYAGTDYTWTYPSSFATGVVPIIEALAVAPAASTALFNVQLVGDPTNVSCKLRVNSIPAASVSLLGLINLNLFQQAASGVKLHVTARAP
jgi:hypothetical protein